MRVKDTVDCDYPDCLLEPAYSYDDGEVVYLVCPRHRSWAADLVHVEEPVS
jgi:hypothetical protein